MIVMYERCIYFNLTTLTRQITKIWQEEFDRLGLSPSHGYLLVAIAGNPAISQKELSELLELDPSTVTRFIDTLVQDGLAEKKDKGKGAVTTVTAKGRRISQQVTKVMDALYSQMKERFGAKRFEAFVSDLSSARQSLVGSQE
jgi:DNA-binding MarR family transcriptional regulator